MKNIANFIIPAFLILLAPNFAKAAKEEYKFDIKGAHAFIQFKIKHLGYSWLLGRFNEFDGKFIIDRDNLENSAVEVEIETKSIDSNHAERDKHLRGEKFLNVKKYPKAKFVSQSVKRTGERTAVIKGNLTLHGVTKPINIDVAVVGEGSDPWGGYRMGFEGVTTLTLRDFDINYDLGPAASKVEMFLSIEGIRQ